MSQYFRTIVFPDKSCHNVLVDGGKVHVMDKFNADIVISSDTVDDECDDDRLTSMDFCSSRSRMTIHSGFECSSPFPVYIMVLLTFLGITLDPAHVVVLAALYEEGGFNEYGREECDRLYLNTVLQGSNWFVRNILYGFLLMFVGTSYKWKYDTDEITVATMEPIWN